MALFSILLPVRAAQAVPKRLHFTAMLGGMEQPSADLKPADSGVNLQHAASLGAGTRYSRDRRLDFTLDAHVVWSMSGSDRYEAVNATVTNVFLGPGVRVHRTNGAFRPFFQANVFAVREASRVEQFHREQFAVRGGVGLGLSFGVDYRGKGSDRGSMPLAIQIHLAKPGDNISGIGWSFGWTYNLMDL